MKNKNDMNEKERKEMAMRNKAGAFLIPNNRIGPSKDSKSHLDSVNSVNNVHFFKISRSN